MSSLRYFLPFLIFIGRTSPLSEEEIPEREEGQACETHKKNGCRSFSAAVSLSLDHYLFLRQLQKNIHYLNRALRYFRTGTEYGNRTGIEQELIILVRNHTAHIHEDVFPT